MEYLINETRQRKLKALKHTEWLKLRKEIFPANIWGFLRLILAIMEDGVKSGAKNELIEGFETS